MDVGTVGSENAKKNKLVLKIVVIKCENIT
jgi:hypothetical protein